MRGGGRGVRVCSGMQRRLGLGLDIGGTHTRGILVDLDSGSVLRRLEAPGVNPAVVGIEEASRMVARLVDRLLRDVEGKVVCIGVGSAGVGRGPWAGALARAVTSRGIDSSAVRVYEDFRIMHAACFEEGDGVVFISGTGSVLYARCKGEEFRIGGWGHLLDDGGSAYQVGRDGMREALRALDGRRGYTMLAQEFLEYLGIRDPVESIPLIYGSPNPKSLIAGFAPRVVEAAGRGDEAARRIIDYYAEEVAEAIRAAERRCGAVPIAMAGGFWEHHRGHLLNVLEKHLGELKITQCLHTPEYAAMLMSCRETQEKPSRDQGSAQA